MWELSFWESSFWERYFLIFLESSSWNRHLGDAIFKNALWGTLFSKRHLGTLCSKMSFWEVYVVGAILRDTIFENAIFVVLCLKRSLGDDILENRNENAGQKR